MSCRKVKITVLKSECDEELFAKYGDPNGVKLCPTHEAGQVFISENWGKPEGLCGGAWAPMEKFVFALANGIDHIQYEGLYNRDRISIHKCNDGLRPVTFLIEPIDDEE